MPRRAEVHRIRGLTEFHSVCYRCTHPRFPSSALPMERDRRLCCRRLDRLSWHCNFRAVLPPAREATGDFVAPDLCRQPGHQGRAGDPAALFGHLLGHRPLQGLGVPPDRAQSATFLDVFRRSAKFSEVQAVCKSLGGSPLVGMFQAGYAELNLQLRQPAGAGQSRSACAASNLEEPRRRSTAPCCARRRSRSTSWRSA